jgi:Asp-tRNA(Asn)/Glu-tRNA(Gln) amidotransferase A subunit family amidase
MVTTAAGRAARPWRGRGRGCGWSEWARRREVVVDRTRSLDADLRGSLAGTAVGVKDVIDTADLPTGYGFPLIISRQPTQTL